MGVNMTGDTLIIPMNSMIHKHTIQVTPGMFSHKSIHDDCSVECVHFFRKMTPKHSHVTLSKNELVSCLGRQPLIFQNLR